MCGTRMKLNMLVNWPGALLTQTKNAFYAPIIFSGEGFHVFKQECSLNQVHLRRIDGHWNNTISRRTLPTDQETGHVEGVINRILHQPEKCVLYVASYR